MDKIYLVTTVRVANHWNSAEQAYNRISIISKRTVGWFPTLSRAIKVIEDNEGDIYEAGHYKYCVIEGVPSGLYPFKSWEKWFKWANGCYTPIKKPEKLGDMYSFGIG